MTQNDQLKEGKTGKKILIAEDDIPLSRALELKFKNAILGKDGYQVEVVNDGEAALEAIKNNHYDLVLLDIMMPKKNGFDVLEELKVAENKTPIIITSNLSQEEDMKRAKDLGAVDYLVKSNIEISKIIENIQKILEK